MISDAKGSSTRVDIETSPHRVGGRAVNLVLKVSPETVVFLDALARERGEDREDVLRNALGLLRIAQDAKVAGNGLAIITRDLEIDQEISGI